MLVSSMFNSRVSYATILFVLVMVLIIIAKPNFLFIEEDASSATKGIRPFGVANPKSTIFSLGVVTVVIAIICMALITVIDIICK